jgi:biopolymer transport protein ExbD
MKAWVDELMNENVGLQIAPLIDVVFLLLIYFMVVSTLKRSEADLQMTLPSAVPQAQAFEMPDEQVIEVLPGGQIILNEKIYNDPNKADLADLEHTLLRFREFSAVMGVPAMITIAADGNSRHERVIDVLNACAGAGIKSITFGSAE